MPLLHYDVGFGPPHYLNLFDPGGSRKGIQSVYNDYYSSVQSLSFASVYGAE